MADAILRLHPQAQLTIGPVVEDGFYYDIYMPDGSISPDDFGAIEAEMKSLAKDALFHVSSRDYRGKCKGSRSAIPNAPYHRRP